MMYSKYQDISYMVNDLCKAFNNDDFVILADVSARMSQDNAFRKKYMTFMQKRYLENLPAILNNKYNKISMSQLHQEISDALKNGQERHVSKENEHESIQNRAALMTMIKKIKNSSQK